MNIPIFVGLAMARANSIQSGSPPTGAPANVDRQLYAGTKIKATWVNTDATATSKVYRSVSGNWVFINTAAAAETSLETGLTSITLLGVSHFKNGQESAITSED